MLKNYTSDVPVSRTISRIEEIIARAKANDITKAYDNGRLVALCFGIYLPNGKLVTIRLPANTDAVYEALMKKIHKPQTGTAARVREQAERTAWKLMQDWIEVQLSLVEMQQAELAQVFLPYLWDGRQTLFQVWKKENYKALPETCGT